MPGGALIQLAAYGPQDVFLTGNPQITHFKAIYRRHTNFAIEQIEETFFGDPDFGNKVYAILGRYGDLVHAMYVHIRLPALNLDLESDFACSWVNSIGNVLIRRAEVEIGGEIIDRQFGQWLEIWGELTIPESKRCGYYDMIGHHENFNATVQQGELSLWIPLRFWFNRHVGRALPIIALQNHDVRINIIFRDFDELWVSTTGEKPLPPVLNNQPRNCDSNNNPGFHMIKATLYVDYIYLDDHERRKFALGEHEYLIEQLQYNTMTVSLTSINNVIEMSFNHPVKELIWVIQDCVFLVRRPNGGNEWFNFSDQPVNSDIMRMDPMIEAKILFDGVDRFCELPAKYFRTVIPYQYHTYTPNRFIYVYSFAEFPEEFQPSGTANFSRIDIARLNIKMIDGLIDPHITIYAHSYNILKVKHGLAGLLYAN